VSNLKDSLKFVGETIAEGGRAIARMSREAAAAASRPTHVCTKCGYVGQPRVESSTNGCFAIVLLLCFIIPGILYMIFTARGRQVCPKCRSVGSMIPLDAPQARVITGQVATAPSPSARTRDERPCPYCAEPILAQARVCKHCRRDVAPPRP
jgi:hypothetical protein